MADLHEGLVALPCALCGLPVCHYDPTVIGSRIGGLCPRPKCRVDRRDGTKRQVYTFAVVVGWPAYTTPSSESPTTETALSEPPASNASLLR